MRIVLSALVSLFGTQLFANGGQPVFQCALQDGYEVVTITRGGFNPTTHQEDWAVYVKNGPALENCQGGLATVQGTNVSVECEGGSFEYVYLPSSGCNYPNGVCSYPGILRASLVIDGQTIPVDSGRCQVLR